MTEFHPGDRIIRKNGEVYTDLKGIPHKYLTVTDVHTGRVFSFLRNYYNKKNWRIIE